MVPDSFKRFVEKSPEYKEAAKQLKQNSKAEYQMNTKAIKRLNDEFVLQMGTKWTEGVDTRKASDTFRPLSKAISALNTIVKNDSASPEQIYTNMNAVVLARKEYLKTISTHLSDALESSIQDEQANANAIVFQQSADVSPKNYQINLMSDLVSQEVPLPDHLYLAQDGQYIVNDVNDGLKKGSLKGIIAMDNLKDKIKDRKF